MGEVGTDRPAGSSPGDGQWAGVGCRAGEEQGLEGRSQAGSLTSGLRRCFRLVACSPPGTIRAAPSLLPMAPALLAEDHGLHREFRGLGTPENRGRKEATTVQAQPWSLEPQDPRSPLPFPLRDEASVPVPDGADLGSSGV